MMMMVMLMMMSLMQMMTTLVSLWQTSSLNTQYFLVHTQIESVQVRHLGPVTPDVLIDGVSVECVVGI